MVNSCAAFGCTSRAGKQCGFSFHVFPKEPERREEWIDATRRKNYKPTPSSVLCSRHFKDEDYDPYRKGSLRVLRRDAVPSIFDFPAHIGLQSRKRRTAHFVGKVKTRKSPASRQLLVDPARQLIQPRKTSDLQHKSHCNGQLETSSDVNQDLLDDHHYCLTPRSIKRKFGEDIAKLQTTCCVSGCKEQYRKDGPITFHKYPQDPKRQKAWVQANKRTPFIPNKHTRICSKHFTIDSFTGTTMKDLKKNAVPTIFDNRKRKLLKILPDNSDESDEDEGPEYSAPEYLLEDMPPDIKEEPLRLYGYSQQPTVWLPQEDFISEAVDSKLGLLQPVVCLTRHPFAEQSDVDPLVTKSDNQSAAENTLEKIDVHPISAETPTTIEGLLTPREMNQSTNDIEFVDVWMPPPRPLAGSSRSTLPSNVLPNKKALNSILKNSGYKLVTKSSVKLPSKVTEPTVKVLVKVKPKVKAPPVVYGPNLDIVFVKVEENWNEKSEPKLYVVETTSVHTDVSKADSWTMSLSRKSPEVTPKTGEVAEQVCAQPKPPIPPPVDLEAEPLSPASGSDNDPTEDLEAEPLSPASGSDNDPTEDLEAEPSSPALGSDYDPTKDATPTEVEPEIVIQTRKNPPSTSPAKVRREKLLARPLEQPEGTLAQLQSLLNAERSKNKSLEKQLAAARAFKVQVKLRLKHTQQKLRRLQTRFLKLQLLRGQTAAPKVENDNVEDFTWSET